MRTSPEIDAPRRAARANLMATARRLSLIAMLVALGPAISEAGFVTTGNLTFSAAKTSPVNVDFNESVNVLGINFFVDFLFNPSGSWDVSNTSRLQAIFPDRVAAPGMFTVSLRQIPLSSSFSSSFGMNGEVGATAQVFGLPVTVSDEYGLGFRTSKTGTGSLTSISDTDNDIADPAPTFGIPFGILSATAGVRADVTTTATFAALKGTLSYSNRTTGAGGSLPFHLTSSSLAPLNVALNDPGTYDFQLNNPRIVGSLDNRTVFSISIFGTLFGNDTDDIRIPIAPNSSSDAFSASAGVNSIPNWFSIEVASPAPGPSPVPEPMSLAIALQGAGTILFLRRRRDSRPGKSGT